MEESTISSKGQVTVPKAIRTRLRLKVGDRLRFVVEADGTVKLAAATRDVAALQYLLPRPKRRGTLAQMDEAIRQGMKRRSSS